MVITFDTYYIGITRLKGYRYVTITKFRSGIENFRIRSFIEQKRGYVALQNRNLERHLANQGKLIVETIRSNIQ